MMASALLASSAGVAASRAPASATGLVLSAERFQTVTLWPTSISRCAMAAPILPMPAIPMCMEFSYTISVLPSSPRKRDQASAKSGCPHFAGTTLSVTSSGP